MASLLAHRYRTPSPNSLHKLDAIAFCLLVVAGSAAPSGARPLGSHGRSLTAAELTTLWDVVTVSVNVESGTATCADWFGGPVNDYLAAMATYSMGATPSVSCRQSANTVHRMELVGPEPGANLFFDDPRKVSEAVGELRNLEATNRVSLNVNFFFNAPTPGIAQTLFSNLNSNIRSGDFLSKMSNATYPLLKAVAYQETFNGLLAEC